MDYVFAPPATISLPIVGSDLRFPVRRVFCVGRNYAAHAAEMGGTVDREAPWYFTKSVHAVAQSGQTVPYPQGTQNYHHEVEYVLALGGDAQEVSVGAAEALIFGVAVGLDMTRRDLQQVGKDNRRPWDLGKDVENGAVIGPITPLTAVDQNAGRGIRLTVNGETRQAASLDEMVWSPAEVISHLSGYYHLRAGDVIMTGTPAGVGPVVAGDHLVGEIDGLAPVTLTLK